MTDFPELAAVPWWRVADPEFVRRARAPVPRLITLPWSWISSAERPEDARASLPPERSPSILIALAVVA